MADDRCQPLQGSPARGWSEGRESRDESYKRGLNTKLHLAVDAHGMPLRDLITQGTTADSTQAIALIDGLSAEHLLADRGDFAEKIRTQSLRIYPYSPRFVPFFLIFSPPQCLHLIAVPLKSFVIILALFQVKRRRLYIEQVVKRVFF